MTICIACLYVQRIKIQTLIFYALQTVDFAQYVARMNREKTRQANKEESDKLRVILNTSVFLVQFKHTTFSFWRFVRNDFFCLFVSHLITIIQTTMIVFVCGELISIVVEIARVKCVRFWRALTHTSSHRNRFDICISSIFKRLKVYDCMREKTTM